jgi:Mitochondrial carrier protein
VLHLAVNEGAGASGRLMTNRPQYSGLVNAAVTIARESGIRGLYQGVTPNVWGAGASWGLYFMA